MQIESARARSVDDTRKRILDVALEVLGQNPDSGMGDIASAAGVVRRTVYGYFPTRTDLVPDEASIATSSHRSGRRPATPRSRCLARLSGPPDG